MEKGKASLVRKLIFRPEGATHKELKKALGWTALNVYEQANLGDFGVVSIKPKGRDSIRYYGIPKGAKLRLVDDRTEFKLN
jgi:hypothetical protein